MLVNAINALLLSGSLAILLSILWFHSGLHGWFVRKLQAQKKPSKGYHSLEEAAGSSTLSSVKLASVELTLQLSTPSNVAHQTTLTLLPQMPMSISQEKTLQKRLSNAIKTTLSQFCIQELGVESISLAKEPSTDSQDSKESEDSEDQLLN